MPRLGQLRKQFTEFVDKSARRRERGNALRKDEPTARVPSVTRCGSLPWGEATRPTVAGLVVSVSSWS
ncbi:MAG: hypothetical protein KDA86_27340, partial [Planctomycetaceae bacterium]|nr:hypothetical protein [Planctomycetaceae bacterium]